MGETEESGEDLQDQQEPHVSVCWEVAEERRGDVCWPGDSHQLRQWWCTMAGPTSRYNHLATQCFIFTLILLSNNYTVYSIHTAG